jgi:predicted DNA binding protein
MPLAEVVFEVEAPATLVRFTKDRPDVRAVVRYMGLGTPQARALVTLAGPTEVTAGLVRALKEEQGPGEFEVLSITPYSVVLKMAPQGYAAWMEPAQRFLDVFGRDTLLEPALAEQGRLRLKGMPAQQMDTRRALEKLQELQRLGGWDGFRVVRVSEFDPKSLGDRSAGLLEPEQEELVRLAIVMGYYDTPRRCNLEDIAARVGLSVSPVHKKLKEVEHTLIHAHLEPHAPRPIRRRRQGKLRPSEPTGLMREVLVRLDPGPTFAPAAFTREHPEARVVYQALPDEPGAQALLHIVLGGPDDARAFLQRVEADPQLLGFEVLSSDTEHVSLKVRRKAQPSDGADPLAQIASTLGRDAYVKPAVVEKGLVLGRIVVMRRLGEEELAETLHELAHQHGWAAAELVSVKDVAIESALLARPRGERMTARQEEVLRIAHALGYYRTPRGCTLEDVAATLGISANAVHKNLTAAEQRIIQEHLAAGW